MTFLCSMTLNFRPSHLPILDAGIAGMYHFAHLFSTEGKIQDFIHSRKAVHCLSYPPNPMAIALWAFSTVSVT